ncbi:MAG: DUF3566 domain-containing protein [Frankiaceae bacterium]
MSDVPGRGGPPAGSTGPLGVQGTRPGRPMPEPSPAPQGAYGPAGRAAVATAPNRPAPAGASPRGPRRARLTVRRVDPWSVLKFSFVFSVAILVIWIVAVAILYGMLNGMGLFDKINSLLADFSTKDSQWRIDLTASRVVGWAAVIGGVNAILFTALATLGAFMYNLCSSLAGGIDVTLTERD